MHQDQIDYRAGLRSRPMTDAERLLDDARRTLDAYLASAGLPEIAGTRCSRG